MRQFIGIPYKFGGKDAQGLDCATFILYAYKHKLGIDVLGDKRISNYGTDYKKATPELYEEELSKVFPLQRGTFEDISNLLRENDIILFDLIGQGNITHTGIYLGNNKIIHCQENSGVVLHKLSLLRKFVCGYARYRS